MAFGALLFCGCGGPSAAVRGAQARSEAGGSPLEKVVLSDRPPLTLVARAGDPHAATAFVGSHARGSTASAALAGLIAARLEAQGLNDAQVRAHGLGIEIVRIVDATTDVARFVHAVRAALTQPVTPSDPALGRARRELEALKALSFSGEAEALAAACSGELGEFGARNRLDLSKATDIARLDAARSAIFRVESAAFAALGSPEILEAANRAVADEEPWPEGAPDEDSWPDRDLVAAEVGNGPRRLTLALRVGDANAAIGAGLALGTPGSSLVEQLVALSPPWRLERASAIARRRGACLRLDLAPPAGDPAPTGAEIGLIAALVEAHSSAALASTSEGSLEESVLRPSDPLRAASLAAWRALPSARDDGPQRSTIAYLGNPGETLNGSQLKAAVSASRDRLKRPSFDVLTRVEAGQGELWMLLASPCGTAAEDDRDAGALALLARALTERSRGSEVQLEPWVTPDGIGFLAHAPRLSMAETPLDHAERVARVLGRALAGHPSGSELAGARAELLEEIGARPLPGWTLALDGLSPGHPSWLEPRGTWATVSELTTEQVERARRQLLSGPLRFAVLASRGETQSTIAARQLETWLLPNRLQVNACSALRGISPRHGQGRIVGSAVRPLEGAYVGALFGESGPTAARAAALTEVMLNRPSGVLDRALQNPALGASARAHVLGGSRRPALLIDVRALPGHASEAVGAISVALDQLARGSISAEERNAARREFVAQEANARFDPRRRIVELWRGERASEPDDLALRVAQGTLGSSGQWIVLTVSESP